MLFGFDIQIFNFINQGLANPFFDLIMPWVTKMGDSLYIAGFGVLFFILGKKYTKLSALVVLASSTAAWWASHLVKIYFARPRPFEALEGVRLLDMSQIGFSFPSGHTTVAFCVGTALAMRYPRIRIPVFILAALVGFSRVYLGVHYPGDVLGGAAIGILVGYTFTGITARYIKE